MVHFNCCVIATPTWDERGSKAEDSDATQENDWDARLFLEFGWR